MTVGLALRGACLVGIAVATAVDISRGTVGARLSWARAFLALVCVAFITVLVAAWVNHVTFPLHLVLMEESVLQHAKRAASGMPVYPDPTPSYVALAYNPLFYFLAAPAIRVFGPSLAVLRIVAIIGMAGCCVVIFLAVRRRTASTWWALMAVGAFAAAYQLMDAYLDTAHSDSWMLFMALLGTYIIDRSSTARGRAVGVVVLVLGFWFKQHGAVFVVGALLYLTWREGLRAALGYWAVAVLLGPIAYLAASPWPFGSAFHYFTWTVPSRWSRFDGSTVKRLFGNFSVWYPFAGLAALSLVISDARQPRQRFTIWDAQFIAGLATAVMGALDWGSANNVFIPCGTFTLVLATMALAQFASSAGWRWRQAAAPVGVALVLLPLVYDPRRVLLPLGRAKLAYADLVSTVRAIGAPVYDPDVGRAPDSTLFLPQADWIALEDLGRGPGHSQADRTRAWELLAPVTHPQGPMYLLSQVPLERAVPPIDVLSRYYTLERDFGDRFAALAGQAKHYVSPYPRYLYRFSKPTSDTSWVVPR